MNLVILLLIISQFFISLGAGIGTVLGIGVCYLIFGEQGRKIIEYHLTHWSWWDLRV